MSISQKPVRWGMVGLRWVATDFVAPGIVKSPGSELVACLRSGTACGSGRNGEAVIKG